MYISNEQTYNNMHQAMTDFNNKLFKIEHKSYYTKLEIDILDEYRSFANATDDQRRSECQKVDLLQKLISPRDKYVI
jgi:hypothetical protein